MEIRPKVSIVIPVYNGANYLREAIDSALAQSYENIEIIVVNDGSTDGGKTEETAKSYGDKLLYLHKENGGVASALNLGIKKMRGEYFSWLSHDDVYCPDKVEVQINYLKNENKNNLILYSDYDLIDSQSNFVKMEKIKHVEPQDFRYALIMSNPINGCTVLVPRSCFEVAGTFDERLKTTQDYDLWFRMAKEYDFMHLPAVLIKSRVHAEQGTVTLSSIHTTESNNYFIKCLNQIDSNDMRPIGISPALFYVKTAINLKRRHFFEAAAHALVLSEKSLLEKGKIFSMRYRILRNYYYLYDVKLSFKRLRTKIKLRLKRKLRKSTI
jgi:glycosyltransferase involved in cell wall biosynthesis